MSELRTESGQMLPAIRNTGSYTEEGAVNAWHSPRNQVRAISRIDYIEDRINQQQRTTQELLERAYKIKEDVIDNLNITHTTWQDEKQARELLQEHIRTITDVVRKLSRDIQVVEEQIKYKDGSAVGTENAVKNLEIHHVAGLTDIRGRVARCDAAISRLSTDMKTCYDSIKVVNSQAGDHNSKTQDRLGTLESRFNDLLGKLDKSNSSNQLHLRQLENDTSSQMTGLDNKTRSMIEDTRNTMSTYKIVEENEREKMESKLLTHVDRQQAAKDAKMDKFEKKVEDSLTLISIRLQKLEEDLQKEKDRSISAQLAFESKMNNILESHRKQQREDTAKVKRECREGFATVHESITNMKQVMDGRRKLLEEQLRKEVGQIRKMVVLI